MLKVENEYPLFSFSERYPEMSHLCDVDKYEINAVPNLGFRQLNQHNFDIYLVVKEELKKSKPSQIYSFDSFQIIQVPNAQCYSKVEEVQLIRQQTMISLTFSQEIEKKKTFFGKPKKLTEYVTQIYQLNKPHKALTIKTDSYHYVHFIDNEYFFYLDEKRHCNIMQLETDGQNIIMKSTHIPLPFIQSQILLCQGINNQIFIVSQLMKQSQPITYIDWIMFNKDKSLQQISLSTKYIDTRFSFHFRINPKEYGAVLQQNGSAACFNIMRREVLEFKTPVVAIVNSNDLNPFEKYLAYQQSVYQVLFSQGLAILFRLDFEKNATFIIVLTCSRYTKTQIIFTHIGKSQSCDLNELKDIVTSIQFIISENPQMQISSNMDAILACSSYMSQFFSQTVNVQYVPFCMNKQMILTDYLPDGFISFLKNPKPDNQLNYNYIKKSSTKLNMDQVSELIDRFGNRLIKLNPLKNATDELSNNSSSSILASIQKENFVEASNSQTFQSNFHFNVELRENKKASLDIISGQSSQFSHSQSQRVTHKQSNFIDDYFTQMNESDESRDNELRTMSNVDFLKPETMDVNFTKFKTVIQKQKQNMPVPQHMQGLDCFSYSPFINRFHQYFSNFQTSSAPVMLVFDYHNQSYKMVQFDFNLKNLQEFTNIMLNYVEKDQHFQKIKLSAVYQTLKRTMFIEAYWLSGIMQEELGLINSYSRNWQQLTDKLIEAQFIDTRFIANLTVSKSIVNCFMSFVNRQTQIPYLNNILYHLSYCLQALLSNQYDFIKLEDRFNFDLQQNPQRYPEFGQKSRCDTPNQDSHAHAESSKEFSKFIDENPYFLADGDGKLINYYEMAGIADLTSFDAQYSKQLRCQLEKMNAQISQPRYISRNMSSDLTAHSPFVNKRKRKDNKDEQVFSKLYILFSQVRYLFPEVALRNLYNSTYMTKPQHSNIHCTINSFILECKKIQKLATILNASEIDQIGNLISSICQNTVLACIDYLATQLLQFQQLDENMVIALVEVVENGALPISKIVHNLICKFIGQDCEPELVLQLQSYLVIF